MKRLILLPMILLSIECLKECSFQTSRTFRNNQFISIMDFERLDQLEFNCSQPINMSMWEIKPNDPLILDHKLNLTGLTIQPIEENFAIFLTNFIGFDLNSNPFQNFKIINYSLANIWWNIDQTKFNFYLNGELLTENQCNSSVYNKNFMQKTLILRLNKRTIYSLKTCPYVFRNTLIKLISIEQISSSFINTNILSFLNKEIVDLNSRIFQLNIYLYHIYMDEKLLNKHVFKYLTVLDLNGVIENIQPDLFKSLENIRFIRLRTQNVQNLFNKNNKWIQYLNYNIKVNINDSIEIDRYKRKLLTLVLFQSFENLSFYNYPDEDFCYFKDFPHERLVVPVLRPNKKSHCSCTELYLIQYSFKFSDMVYFLYGKVMTSYFLLEYYYDSATEPNFYRCINESIEQSIHKCNFKKRLNQCTINEPMRKTVNDFYFGVYDWNELAIFTKKLFKTYLNLILIVFVIIIHAITILILSDDSLIKDKMYLYLKINSFVNLFYVLILLIKYKMNSCGNEISCSKIYSSVYSQYYNIVFTKLFGNTLKTLSNIAHISFTLSRYIKITNTSHWLLVKFNKISIQLYLLIVIMFSTGINTYVFFEYSIRNSTSIFSQMHSVSLAKLSNYRDEPIDDYKENFSKSEFLVLNILQYFKIVFSDLFYILVSTVIDLLLFFFVKNKMDLKKSLTNNMTALNLIVNPFLFSATGRAKNKKQRNRNKTCKDRISQMIILNGINYLVFRFPLAVLSFYGFIFRYDKESEKFAPNLISYIVCKRFRFCSSLEEFLFFFYFSSFAAQFLIFYKLDKNFKMSALRIIFLVKMKLKIKILNLR